MLGRERREERRAERRGATRYTLREKMLLIGDDFWVEDSDGEKIFKVDGKALRIRKTLIIESRDGRELAKVQERMLHIKDSMSIEGPDGQEVALVKKALISPIRHRFEVKMAAGGRAEGAAFGRRRGAARPS